MASVEKPIIDLTQEAINRLKKARVFEKDALSALQVPFEIAEGLEEIFQNEIDYAPGLYSIHAQKTITAEQAAIMRAAARKSRDEWSETVQKLVNELPPLAGLVCQSFLEDAERLRHSVY